MEATGGYENPLFAILQANDLNVVVTAGLNTTAADRTIIKVDNRLIISSLI